MNIREIPLVISHYFLSVLQPRNVDYFSHVTASNELSQAKLSAFSSRLRNLDVKLYWHKSSNDKFQSGPLPPFSSPPSIPWLQCLLDFSSLWLVEKWAITGRLILKAAIAMVAKSFERTSDIEIWSCLVFNSSFSRLGKNGIIGINVKINMNVV